MVIQEPLQAITKSHSIWDQTICCRTETSSGSAGKFSGSAGKYKGAAGKFSGSAAANGAAIWGYRYGRTTLVKTATQIVVVAYILS